MLFRILRRGFLDECAKNQQLANDPFSHASHLEEWEIKPAWNSNNRSLKAPKHWRIRGGGSVYAGWRFKIHEDANDQELTKNADSYRMVLRSGGAIEDAFNPTHIITNETFKAALEYIYRL